MRSSRARLLSVGVLVVAMQQLVHPAFAGPRSPQPVDVVETVPAGELCDFPLEIRVSGKTKTIELPGGRSISTSPGADAVITNLGDPSKSVSLGITGAFHVARAEDRSETVVATGRNLLFDPEAGFVLSVGRFSFGFDSAGNLVRPLSGRGRLVGICTLIA